METSELLLRWVNEGVVEPGSSLGEEGGALVVDGWWPVAVRLDPTTFLVRMDESCPEPGLAAAVTAALDAHGLRHLEGDWAIVESISLQRLGLLGARWHVWGDDADSARRTVSRAAAGDGGVDL